VATADAQASHFGHPDSSVIHFESVTKTYPTKSESVNALDHVSFKVERGSAIAIVGPSGSGKTTLLNMAAGLDFPTSGHVEVAGFATSELQREPLQKFRNEVVGVVFQQFFLIDHLSVFQNVSVPLLPREVPSAEKSRRVLEAISKVGLADKADRLPSELSGGELQRVAIARGLVGDASVILADEPTGNLDSKKGSEIVGLLVAESRERHKTVLIATHDLRVLEHVDGVVHLEDGRLSKIEGRGISTA
jgi:putative ABC transport system ATP-binding protein